MKNQLTRLLLLAVLIFSIASCSTAQQSPSWDVKSDTWTGTDALGRTLPGYTECGSPRSGKFVGIFYFLWHNGTEGPYDITKILSKNPVNPEWGHLYAFHHWGEPELGYYLSNDDYVIRKHCRMLAAAGVDTLIFDASNSFTYQENYLKLCETYRQLRNGGERTPQICFLVKGTEGAQNLYNEFYAQNLYPELWFRWQGKPLILVVPPDHYVNTAPVALPNPLNGFFTTRTCWAWSDPSGWFGSGRNRWCWLDGYNTRTGWQPQQPGWHTRNLPEEVSVSVAEHPTSNIGRSFNNGVEPLASTQRPAKGLFFAEQWQRALSIDPAFLFITGWNEWTAQRFISDGTQRFLGRQLPAGETYFVDAYSQEYSRDIEPMSGGHGDDYYYQMVAGIRRFKGVRRTDAASGRISIHINGDFTDWNNVRPEYRDAVGDTEHRDSVGWGNAGHYINTAGRNDFVRMKVAYDDNYIYFYAQTKDSITAHTDPNWMLLFINTDVNHATGWHGYDYLVNLETPSETTTTVKRSRGGWNWQTVGTVPCRVVGNQMELRIPRSLIGLQRNPITFDFHWADNIQHPDNITDFSISGDSAPDRTFNYHFTTQH